MTKHDERAFPLAAVNKYGNSAIHEGMTLWDYFAAHALTGISTTNSRPKACASWAAETADAMMAERSKRPSAPPKGGSNG